jgi:CRISPR-associated endonuclease/helicase Cas3
MRAAAHTPREPGGEWHDLATHLRDTAALARVRADKFGAGDLARAAGLLHDVGKYNPAFQQYLIDAHTGGRPALSVPHAVHAAILAVERDVPELAFPLYGHHAGLPSRGRLQEAFTDPETREAYERVKAATDGFPVEAPVGSVRVDLRGEMLLRMVFSALVDADYLDTEAHFDPARAALRGGGEQVRRPDDLLPILLEAQRQIMAQKTGTVNDVRREVYSYALEAGAGPRGIYRLVAPTGAGKTRSMLAFALKHAVEHDLDRVIVAVPYTSITDQIAEVAREIFGSEAVLEHHSGVISGEARNRSRLATQNWDAPLVVTTTVQLLESLLSNRPSRCRKLHNTTRSVIVLDEVQTLPVPLLQPIVSVLDELSEHYGVTVVLSTATQPALEGEAPHLRGFSDLRDIVPPALAAEHFRKLRRVRYEVRRDQWSWGRVAAEMPQAERTMAVVNTRQDAADLVEALGDGALHLSASQCAAHRRDVLREVRRRLDADERCLLVATQVVEAGVDLDFDTVLRAYGPLDRIVQAAGRCNREGRLTEGRVVIFRPESGGMPGGEYMTGAYLATNILRRGDDLHDPGVFREYFTRLYQSSDTDAEGIQDLRRNFDYPTVAERFRIVEDAQTDVIIEYDDRASALVERIREEGALRPGDLRRLQPYTVGLFEGDFGRSADQREEIAEGVWAWRGEYDNVRGIVLREGG